MILSRKLKSKMVLFDVALSFNQKTYLYELYMNQKWQEEDAPQYY